MVKFENWQTLRHKNLKLVRNISQGAWGAKSVKRPTLNLGLGHDLAVHEIELRMGLCDDCTEPAWDSLSPSLKKINRKERKKERERKRKRKRKERERKKEKISQFLIQTLPNP